MSAGRLRHRITIEEKAQAPDGVGGFSETWQTFATVWAEVKPLRARERFFAEKIESSITHLVKLRFRFGIDPEMRIMHGGRTLKILGIVNVEERNQWLELSCEEVSGS
jgi:SPP1 family predicted phage head-tail adaptor